jgi:hypothetical protein
MENTNAKDGVRVPITYHIGVDAKEAESRRCRIQRSIDNNGGYYIVSRGDTTVKLDSVELLTKDDKYIVKGKGIVYKK